MRKNKKNTKIQSVFLAAIEKYKKNTKVQGVFFSYFFVFILYFFCIFTKKIRKKYEKNTKKIRIQNLKNTKYKKNTKKYEKNTKYKKIQTQHLQNAKFRKIQTQRRKKKGKSHVHFRKKNPNCKKNAKTTCCIFYTLQF